ncbi:MAG: L,D-transpeptidase family protein [Pseudomonadota bacterium]|nr:L,D-transpeptidase family protein [Pseudomonadota bacterium]
MRRYRQPMLAALTAVLALSSANAQRASVASGASPGGGTAVLRENTGVATRPAPAQTFDATTLHAQVILDRLGFSPGVIDGKQGFTLKLALSAFQQTHNLPVTGTLDAATKAALIKLAALAPLLEVVISQADVAGPYVGALPKREDDQAKLPSLGYANIIEMLAERYHTTPATLTSLNSSDTKMIAGSKISVPNVAVTAHDYPAALPDGYKTTLNGLNVASGQPQAEHLVVSKSKRSLSVYDGDNKLLAQFPVTTGSEHDPLPIGRWKVVGASYNPEFHFNPKLFWDAKKGEKKATLQPGPNGPVGVVWLDLSKQHYGIHGTPEPQNIGRTQSHGCIRMTNWDAARLSLMVKAGTPAIFEQ